MVFAITGAAQAAEVEIQLSAGETIVNAPVQVDLVLHDARFESRPEFPKIDGAEVRFAGGPSIIKGNFNGQRLSTSTLHYELTPKREGTITIPPITVKAGGATLKTKAHTLIVTKSEPVDLLFVDVKADRESVSVGEKFTATLEIWLAPFRDRRTGTRLEGMEMWQQVERERSSLGEFLETVARPERGAVSLSDGRRADSKGQQRSFYVYRISRDFWAEKPGPFDPGDISILVEYPVRIAEGRDFSLLFPSRFRVAQSKPIVADANVAPLTIKPVPHEGRPDYYRGAVGEYELAVSAVPSEVAVGDPITLTLTISGRGRLETLQPPPLPDLPELTKDFKVPSDPLAGVVQGRSKVFTQSVRAKSDSVTQVPPIPFAYFDPEAEKFVTVRSEPIPIRVKPAEVLSGSQIVEAGGRRATPMQLTESPTGILANVVATDDLLANQAFAPGWPVGMALVVPPLAFAACALVQRRRERLRHDVSYARRRTALRTARREIDAAARNGEVESAPRIAAAIRGYVADRCNIPVGGMTTPETVDALSSRNVAVELVSRVRDLLERCEQMQYASIGARDEQTRESLAGAARQCLESLERTRW